MGDVLLLAAPSPAILLAARSTAALARSEPSEEWLALIKYAAARIEQASAYLCERRLGDCQSDGERGRGKRNYGE